MKNQAKLTLVKSFHTLIWVFFNVVIFYMLYAAITNKLDVWLWTGFGVIFLEVMVLLVFQHRCPLTLVARKYSDSADDNFDIYLPVWLARNNKLIYTIILTFVIIITIVQFFR